MADLVKRPRRKKVTSIAAKEEFQPNQDVSATEPPKAATLADVAQQQVNAAEEVADGLAQAVVTAFGRRLQQNMGAVTAAQVELTEKVFGEMSSAWGEVFAAAQEDLDARYQTEPGAVEPTAEEPVGYLED